MAKFCVILPAAGKSSRFRDPNYKKPFALLDNQAVWLHAANLFLNRDDVAQVIVVISPEDMDFFAQKYCAEVSILGVAVVPGGKERVDSIANAIPHILPECDYVCVHDAARPCLENAAVTTIFKAVRKVGAVIFALPITDTLKCVSATPRPQRPTSTAPSLDNLILDVPEDAPPSDGQVLATVARENLWRAQTPQVFRKDWFLAAYALRAQVGAVTDDAALLESAGRTVHILEGSPLNVKITTRQDLALAGAILRVLPKVKRGGFHPFPAEGGF